MPTPQEKWETVKALFEAALEEESPRRSSLLMKLCPDASVRAEVERLLAEHSEAGAFLSTPVMRQVPEQAGAPVRGLSDGAVLAGRFHIVGFIAAGGMGEVYEAEDKELSDRVAIKTIRPEILSQSDSVARFKREVQLARRVTHPNVCRIFDLFRHQPTVDGKAETVFISMELLNGTTLKARLPVGAPFSPDEAVPLIEQMAAALGAAHAAGIVHRDFKPGNVMLVPDTVKDRLRVVVTDFGLALPLLDSEECPSTGLHGTPAYMSPEQLVGRRATAASDIYALGLVIYEMVTGARPFIGDTPISTAMKRLSEEPISPRKLRPELPSVWEEAILRCLQREPEKRYSSAAEVITALRGESAPKRLDRRRVAAGMLLAMCFLVLIAAGLRYRLAHRSEAVQPRHDVRRSVAVLGFKNLSGNPDLAWVSTALSEELTSELAAGERLRTVPGENVAQMKSDLSLSDAKGLGKDTLAKINRLLGSDLLVSGSYLEFDQQLRVDLVIQDTHTGETFATITDTSNDSQLLDLVSRLGDVLRLRCGAGEVPPAQAEAARAAWSSNPRGSRYYAEGLAKLRIYDAVAARDSLQKAVAEDPKFALAHSALAVAWGQLGYEGRSRDEIQKAFDLSASLSREEHLDIEGRYYEASSQWDKSVDIYHTLFTFFPDNIEYGLSLARTQIQGGKTKDAVESLKALRTLPSPSRDDPRIDLIQSHAFEALGDIASAQAAAAHAVEVARLQGARLIQARSDVNLCFALSTQGKFVPARAACEEAEQIYSTSGNRSGLASALMNTGNLLADEEAPAEARVKYEVAIANYRQIGNQDDLAWALNNAGIVIRDLRDYAGARKAHLEALSLFRVTGQKRGEAASFNNLAAVEQGEGNLNKAVTYYGLALGIQKELGDKRRVGLVLRNLADLDYLRGRLRESRENAEAAAAIEREVGSKHLFADALTDLASVQTAEADLEKAERTWRDAESVYTELQNKRSQALCWSRLGRISLERGQISQAMTLAEKAIETYQSEKDAGGEASSHFLRMEIFLASPDVPAAQQELSRGMALSQGSSERETRWERVVATARVQAATGHVPEALRELRSTDTEMRNLGFVADDLEASLLLGEIEVRVGGVVGRADLASVERNARGKGFLLIARKAASALKCTHCTAKDRVNGTS
jgi:tetratricopeptide (TPR) repeat protein/TolB-like protein/tRNA A-37 threonylcarbamoyl transferase component Bud32